MFTQTTNIKLRSDSKQLSWDSHDMLVVLSPSFIKPSGDSPG
jgi:hypothetical protein